MLRQVCTHLILCFLRKAFILLLILHDQCTHGRKKEFLCFLLGIVISLRKILHPPSLCHIPDHILQVGKTLCDLLLFLFGFL